MWDVASCLVGRDDDDGVWTGRDDDDDDEGVWAGRDDDDDDDDTWTGRGEGAPKMKISEFNISWMQREEILEQHICFTFIVTFREGMREKESRKCAQLRFWNT